MGLAPADAYLRHEGSQLARQGPQQVLLLPGERAEPRVRKVVPRHKRLKNVPPRALHQLPDSLHHPGVVTGKNNGAGPHEMEDVILWITPQQ